MQTYTTLDGEVIDLSSLTDDERAYLDRCAAEWRAGTPYDRFYFDLVGGADNPLVGPSRVIRREIMDHPLWRALRDIEARVGIAQGRVAPSPGDEVDRDPFEDEFISVSEAARRKSVTRTAVYGAIERGDVLLIHGGDQSGVSVRSLGRWAVNRDRQRHGRGGRLARTG